MTPKRFPVTWKTSHRNSNPGIPRIAPMRSSPVKAWGRRVPLRAQGRPASGCAVRQRIGRARVVPATPGPQTAWSGRGRRGIHKCPIRGSVWADGPRRGAAACCGGTPLESGLWPREREVCRYDHEGVRPTTGRQVTMSTQGGLARERSSAGFTQIWLAPCRELCAANQQRTLAQILNCIPCACRLQLCLIGLSEPAGADLIADAQAPQRTRGMNKVYLAIR